VKVLVDTPVWSLVLRRRNRPENAALLMRVASIIADGRIAIIGPIRQELLSGLREQSEFERLRGYLLGFPDTQITRADYEEAASFYNRCRGKGIQGSGTDFLMCAIAVRHDFSIFTTDEDFAHYAKVLPIALYADR
jgi:predicted nucleic acid-binding protein